MYAKSEKIEIYRLLLLSRKYCLAIEKSARERTIIGMHHIGLGEESVGTAVAFAAKDGDWITPQQRWAPVWMKRVGLELHSAEQFGKVTGMHKGMCCDLHAAYPEQNILYNNCLMGSNIPLSCGFSYGLKLQGEGRVHIAGVGDGSYNEGLVYEAMEIAAELKCPLVIVIHDNGWGQSYRSDRYVGSLARRADAFGIPSIEVDGNDMPLVLQAMEYAVETARRNIPNLVWAKTHRWAGHYIGDDQSYEDAGETARFRETDDPLKRYEELLLREGVLTAESIRRIGAETDLRMEKAWEANMEADYPGRDLVLDKSKVYAMPWEGNEV